MMRVFPLSTFLKGPGQLVHFHKRTEKKTKSSNGKCHCLEGKQLRSHVLIGVMNKRLRDDFIIDCNFLNVDSGGGGSDLFSLMNSDRTRGNVMKLCQRKLR